MSGYNAPWVGEGWNTRLPRNIMYTAMKKMGSAITPTDEPDSVLDAFKYMPGRLLQVLGSQAESLGLRKMLPKVAAYLGFWKGATKIDRLYTAEINGEDVWICAEGGEIGAPTDSELKDGIRHAVVEKKSPFNDYVNIKRLYNEDFGELGSGQKYSRGDLGRAVIDEDVFYSWFCRDEAWKIQQKGRVESERQLTVDINGTPRTYTVRAHVNPRRDGFLGKLGMFLDWAFADQWYNFWDWPMDIVERLSGDVSAGIKQDMLKPQVKFIAAGWRGITRNHTRPALALDGYI